ncbi:NitT/TauT family transport system substrate-binding protein [Bradyrhizobium sp. S3.12.5]|uniref:ABC transporter substrate-binding protein n=1 Tax=Bradyrhizobium sp. S3.12.5 TaxID=3156386 RepID=UPI003394C9B6
MSNSTRLNALFGAAMMFGAASSTATATEPEKANVSLAVGSMIMNYMPVGLAESRGEFKKEGLTVTVQNFASGGTKALQALIGGSVDVTVGAYDHTIQMQTKGKEIVCVAQLNTRPGFSIGVRASLAEKVNSGRDLKGLRIGITAPGSSADMTVRYYLRRNGLKPADAQIVAVGSGPPGMVALENGNVDALIYWDPIATILQQKKAVKVLLDARTPEGAESAIGGKISPFACLYATRAFIEANPETTQRLVDAFIRTLRFIQQAPAAEIVHSLPDAWKLPGQHDLNVQIMEASRSLFSADGFTDPESTRIPLAILSGCSDEIENFKIDLSKTYTNHFAEEAARRLK